MVYCEKKSNNNNSTVYKYGRFTDALNGEIVINNRGEFNIIKESTPVVPVVFIGKLIGKYRQDFINGIFEDKISFEA